MLTAQLACGLSHRATAAAPTAFYPVTADFMLAKQYSCLLEAVGNKCVPTFTAICDCLSSASKVWSNLSSDSRGLGGCPWAVQNVSGDRHKSVYTRGGAI